MVFEVQYSVNRLMWTWFGFGIIISFTQETDFAICEDKIMVNRKSVEIRYFGSHASR